MCASIRSWKKWVPKEGSGEVPTSLPGEFDQGAGVVNIPVSDVDAQVRRGGAPAPRPDADEDLILQRGIQLPDGAFQAGPVGLAKAG